MNQTCHVPAKITRRVR